MTSASSIIVTARKRAGLSQTELARRAGFPRSVVNAYERGKRHPSSENLAALVAAAGFELGVTPCPDPIRNTRILAQVLDLAEKLPFKPKPLLRYPPIAARAK